MSRIKEGDLFEVQLDNNKKGYFQFVALDQTQLNSEVIRVFKSRYDISDKVEFDMITSDEIQFYIHTTIKFGIKQNLWTKVGNVQLEEDFTLPYFRESGDYGDPSVKISKDWYVWQVNEEMIPVGSLNDEQKKYDIGYIGTIYQIPEIMNTGKTKYFYPSY